MIREFRKLIETFDKIIIFRHVKPDGDAVGSSIGLKTFIKDNFPNKAIYLAGEEIFKDLPCIDDMTNVDYHDALGIVLDTANIARIDDQNFKKCQRLVKIDHHPAVELYGDINFQNEEASATCEFIVDILRGEAFKDLYFSKEAATYFYGGLLTDSLSFKTASTTSNTLNVASFLANKDIDIYAINNRMFIRDRHSFNFASYVRSITQYQEGLAYSIIKTDDLIRFNMTPALSKTFVSELGNVKENKIWALFTQNEDGLFEGSLRSQKEYIINDIANRYNGGGHKNACGVKGLTLENIQDLVRELSQIAI